MKWLTNVQERRHTKSDVPRKSARSAKRRKGFGEYGPQCPTGAVAKRLGVKKGPAVIADPHLLTIRLLLALLSLKLLLEILNCPALRNIQGLPRVRSQISALCLVYIEVL